MFNSLIIYNYQGYLKIRLWVVNLWTTLYKKRGEKSPLFKTFFTIFIACDAYNHPDYLKILALNMGCHNHQEFLRFYLYFS